MPVFARREPPPKPSTDYTRYRPFVREDFCECCAYCLLHEFLAAGKDNFELDHFRPKSDPRFREMRADFYNLYYSCHVCNHYKAAVWPTDELAARGFGFVDPCKETFSTHFSENERGEWTPQSKPGEYTAERLRLNRKHLVEVRRLLREVAELRGVPNLDWDKPTREQIIALLGDEEY